MVKETNQNGLYIKLDETDLIAAARHKPTKQINKNDFNIPMEDLRKAYLIVFINRDGFFVLKDRFENEGWYPFL
jgi:hypothetical protein